MDLVRERVDTWDLGRVWLNPLHHCYGIINTARSHRADKYQYERIAGVAKCVIFTPDSMERKKTIKIVCKLFVILAPHPPIFFPSRKVIFLLSCLEK